MTKDPRIKRAGVSGFNKPKRTPSHPTKSHVVVAKEGDKIKTIRFGQQGVKGAGKNPKTAKKKQENVLIMLDIMLRIPTLANCQLVIGPTK